MEDAERAPVKVALEPGEAVYLYCLARRGRLPAIDGPGVSEMRALRLSAFEEIMAVVSTVELEEFCGPAAEERMRDLAWVGPRACRHQGVIERAMQSSPVVPARFATLFSSEEALAAWLATHHEIVSRALDGFEDHEEWAVKGALDERKAEAPLLAAALEMESSALSMSPGARYLAERRIRAGIGQAVNAWLKEVCRSIAADLIDASADFRERAVGPAGSAEGSTRVLNWAFLVPRRTFKVFCDRIERLNAENADRGLVLDLSGPWPPYSFCPTIQPESPE